MKIKTFSILFFTICLSAVVFGQQAKLEGYVYQIRNNGKEFPVSAVKVGTPHGEGQTTDAKGHFMLSFPITVQAGQATRIEIVREGWVIYEPMLGDCVTQGLMRNYKPLKVTLVEKLSPLALSPRRLIQVISKWSKERTQLSHQIKEQQRELDEYAFLREYAETYGFTLDQFKDAANRWANTKKSRDEGERAWKEYWLKNYDIAERLADKVALSEDGEHMRLQQEAFEHALRAIEFYQLKGSSQFMQYKFEEAIETYSKIESRFASTNPRERYAQQNFPKEWAETKVLLGNAKQELGVRVEGQRSRSLLEEAVSVYRAALQVYTQEQLPQQWAITQKRLGAALMRQGERVEGEKGKQFLVEAVKAYNEALKVITLKQSSGGWADIQNNLGFALRLQGERTGGEEGKRLLVEAVKVYNEALDVRTRAQFPEQWADIQANLGLVLRLQGERAGGEEGKRLLDKAVETYDEVLKVRTLEKFRESWADAQNNRGLALETRGKLAEGKEGKEFLVKAVNAYNEALRVRTRVELAQPWAETTNNLANTLSLLGELTEGAEGVLRLDEALKAYKDVLNVYTQKPLPLYWARTQNNLGVVLMRQSLRVDPAVGEKLLADAVIAYKHALDFFTSNQFPEIWGGTRYNLGYVYFSLKKWEEAAACFEDALTVYKDYRPAYQSLTSIYQERLSYDKYEKAFDLHRSWNSRFPKDVSILADLTEAHFTTGRFAEYAKIIKPLLADTKLAPSTKIALQMIEVANRLALGQADQVPALLTALQKDIAAQPPAFHIEWSFNGTLRFINQHEKLAIHRDWLNQFFATAQAENREAISTALGVAVEKFPVTLRR